MSESLIEARELTKKYGSVTALDRLSLDLRPGEVLGLLGSNGAGKTTALHIFLGLLAPTSGHVSVLGLSPIKQRPKLAQRINFSSAYVTLPSNLKVMENMLTFARIYGVKNRREKIDSLLELFAMTHLTNRLTGALSSGERTRLNLCKCFLNDPDLLLLDEPTASLDPEMADNVRKVLQEILLKKKIGIIYTSHNMKEVEELCDRVLFINHGKIIAEGTHDELKQKYQVMSLEDVFIQIVRNQQ